MNKIGFIGCGVMGLALATGFKKKYQHLKLGFVDIDQKAAEKAAASLQGKHFASIEKLLLFADITIIAVKPQHLTNLFKEIGSLGKDKNFVSVVAGKSITFLQQHLKTKHIIRCMPNIAAQVGKSAIGIAAGADVDESFYNNTMQLLNGAGTPYPLQESQLAAITGLAGSGIAFVFDFIHAMSLGGTDAGIPYDVSLDITLTTLQGAVELLKDKGEHPARLITNVTSAGGTTIKGVKVLERAGFRGTVMEAVKQATDKALELEAYHT